MVKSRFFSCETIYLIKVSQERTGLYPRSGEVTNGGGDWRCWV